jgi:very-short-patch-repair endonuclease
VTVPAATPTSSLDRISGEQIGGEGICRGGHDRHGAKLFPACAYADDPATNTPGGPRRRHVPARRPRTPPPRGTVVTDESQPTTRKTTWREQFENSLIEHIDGHDLSAALSVNDYIDGYIGTRPREESLALRLMAVQAFQRAYYEFEAASEATESPIEHAMLLALTLMGRSLLFGGAVYFTTKCRQIDADDYEYLVIEPQASIGDYRVDFLLTHATFEDDPEPIRDPDGRVRTRLIVECDGHDFHDRTKAQASRDRARDRDLQSRGIRVYRYTGADIWKDVMACAKEAIEALRGM